MNKLNRAKIGSATLKILRFVFLVAMIYILVFPLLVMLSRSLRSVEDMYNPAVVWIPQHFTLENFKEAAEFLNYMPSLARTGLLSVLCTLLTMVSCSMAGYALGRYNIRGRGFLTVMAIVTIVVPIQSYIIPLFFRFRFFDYFPIFGELLGMNTTVNLVNGDLPYYILSATGMGLRSGLFIWIFMQFFRSLPKELDDASRIDGCGEAGTFIKIMLPNALSPYLVTFILSIVWYWNDTVYSSVLSKNEPLMATNLNNIKALLLASWGGASRGDGAGESGLIFAATLLFILPPLIMYLFAQKFFMQSVERTGIVG